MRPHITVLVEQICNNDPGFNHLVLPALEYSDEEIKAITSAFQRNKNIHTCDFSGIKISTEAYKDLCKAFEFNQTVHVLFIDESVMENESIEALANLIKDNKSLRVLRLARCKLGDIGLERLGKALKVNKTLSSITLLENAFTMEQFNRVFSDVLKVNRTIRYLGVEPQYTLKFDSDITQRLSDNNLLPSCKGLAFDFKRWCQERFTLFHSVNFSVGGRDINVEEAVLHRAPSLRDLNL